MLKLYLALILLGFATQINCENVPAFIFGDKTPSHLPTLNHLNGDEFATLVKSQGSKDSLTVVFVEEKLSVEDFSQCRLKTKTCFENLNNIKSKSYLSSVEQPVDSLISAFSKQKSITVSTESDLKDAKINGEKILFVYFDEVDGAEDFFKHDALISKLYNQLKEEHDNIIAVYTGIHPSFTYSESLKRKVKREAEAEADAAPAPAEEKPVSEKPAEAAEPKVEPEAHNGAKPVVKPKQQDDEVESKPQKVFADTDKHVLVAISDFLVNEESVGVESLTINVVNNSEYNFTANLVFDGTHKLSIETAMTAGTWTAHFKYNDNNEETEVFRPVYTNVYAFGDKFGFGCGNLTIANTKRTTRLHLIDFQYEPRFMAEADADGKFTDYVSDCVGFFSPAIWGAIFVIILLLSIMTWGLYMMMDIRTMDRFDDPKGKTIIINAQE